MSGGGVRGSFGWLVAHGRAFQVAGSNDDGRSIFNATIDAPTARAAVREATRRRLFDLPAVLTVSRHLPGSKTGSAILEYAGTYAVDFQGGRYRITKMER